MTVVDVNPWVWSCWLPTPRVARECRRFQEFWRRPRRRDISFASRNAARTRLLPSSVEMSSKERLRPSLIKIISPIRTRPFAGAISSTISPTERTVFFLRRLVSETHYSLYTYITGKSIGANSKMRLAMAVWSSIVEYIFSSNESRLNDTFFLSLGLQCFVRM